MTDTGALREDLVHHARQVAPLGERVPVSAVSTGNVIARTEVQADADGTRLLPGG
jgi:hypothetical protein